MLQCQAEKAYGVPLSVAFSHEYKWGTLHWWTGKSCTAPRGICARTGYLVCELTLRVSYSYSTAGPFFEITPDAAQHSRSSKGYIKEVE